MLNFLNTSRTRKLSLILKTQTRCVLNGPKRNAWKITKKLRQDAEKLDWSGLEWPVAIKDIGIFEQNNSDYAVNVFAYDEKKDFFILSDTGTLKKGKRQ